jgi:hypothetical protein
MNLDSICMLLTYRCWIYAVRFGSVYLISWERSGKLQELSDGIALRKLLS